MYNFLNDSTVNGRVYIVLLYQVKLRVAFAKKKVSARKVKHLSALYHFRHHLEQLLFLPLITNLV